MPRRYQKAWEQILSEPGKTVKIKAKEPQYTARIRKAVWKEKERDQSKDTDGNLLKKRWRLTCEVLEDGITMIFKLVPFNSILNI